MPDSEDFDDLDCQGVEKLFYLQHKWGRSTYLNAEKKKQKQIKG